MHLKETEIDGVFIVHFFNAGDDRGKFIKPFHKGDFEKHGLVSSFEESFYSISQKGVVRGMHFQKPPFDHAKLVYCNTGKLNDVILDIRKDSKSFQKSISIELNGNLSKGVYIPSGCAHGFEVMEDNTMMTYLTSTMHSPAHDAGILWSSFGHKWQTENALLSERDTQFPRLDQAENLLF